MTSHEDNAAATAAEPGPSAWFRPPRRRRKALLGGAAVVLVVVVYLVYLMARGPDNERMAARLVESTLAALPAGTLSAPDIRAGADALQRALHLHPNGDVAREASGLLQRRVAQQVETDIVQGALDRANEALAEAAAGWPAEKVFAEDGPLRTALEEAQERRSLAEEAEELLAAAEDRLARDPWSSEAIREALQMLRRALDLDPENAQARAVREDIRADVKTATREALQSGETEDASRLLDAVEGNWSGDSDLARLREEVERQVAEHARAVDIQRLLGLADRRLAADRLMTPPGDNAADYYRQVLGLEPENASARSGLARIAERYAVLIADAIDRGALGRAEGLVERLAALSPGHLQLASFRERMQATRQAVAPAPVDHAGGMTEPAAAPMSETPTSRSDMPPADMPTDDEGRLWYEVRSSCVDAELRRYIEAYPAGRYIEEAWRRISSCIESR